MPYLSRLLLNPARAQTRRLFADPQLTKGAILGEFARQPVSERVLWRLGHRSVVAGAIPQGELLVLTQSRPSWVGLVERFGYPGDPDGEPEVRSYEPLLAMVAHGREFTFRVRVNPVQNTVNLQHPNRSEATRFARDNHFKSLRVAHRTSAAQTDWFLRRTEKWGFLVPDSTSGAPDLRLTERERLDFAKGGIGGHRVRIGTATFEGRLRVVDVDRLTASLVSGIGPAKGYGCGLLTLAGLRHVTG